MPVILLIGFALIVVVIVAAAHGREKANTAWQAAATRLDLAYTPASFSKSPRLEGTISGHPVKVDIETRNRGKGHSQLTRFHVGMPPNVPDLKLRKESFFSKVSQAFGGSDVQVGHAGFDEQFNIGGRSPGAIREFLTPRRRQVLERYFTTHPDAKLEEGALIWSTQGRVNNASHLIASIEDLLTVANALANGEEPAVKDEPEAVLEHEPEPEPELEPVSDVVADVERETEPIVENIAEPELVPETGVHLDEFCSAVFADRALSYEATRVFDASYKDEAVAWSGVIESVVPYSFDFLFGSGKGKKATIELTKLTGKHIGDGVVRAIVQLPADHELTADSVGQRVAFTGALVKVDGLMRKVFVADGVLTGDA